MANKFLKDIVLTSIDGVYVDARAYSTLALAVAAIGANYAELVITTAFTVAADLVIPSNVTLRFSGNGLISVSVGQTLTIYSPQNVIASPTQNIFTGLGDVKFTVGGEIFPGHFKDGTWIDALQKAEASVDLYKTLNLDGVGIIDTDDELVINNEYCSIKGKARIEGTDISGVIVKIGAAAGIALSRLEDLILVGIGSTVGIVEFLYVTNFELSGAYLRGTDMTGVTTYGVKVIDGGYLGTVRNCRIQGSYLYGVYIYKAGSTSPHSLNIFNTWVHCNSHANSTGIHSEGAAYNVTVRDCYIQGTSLYGFYFKTGNRAYLENLFVEVGVTGGGAVGRIDTNGGKFLHINANVPGCTNGILVYGDYNIIEVPDWVAYPVSGYQVEVQAGASNNVIYTRNPNLVLDGGTNTQIINTTAGNVKSGSWYSNNLAEFYGFIRKVAPKTTNYTVHATNDNGKTFTNEGATGTILFSLPTATVGLNYIFHRVASFNLHIGPKDDTEIMNVHAIDTAVDTTAVDAVDLVHVPTGGNTRFRLASDNAFLVLYCHVVGEWIGYGFGDFEYYTP